AGRGGYGERPLGRGPRGRGPPYVRPGGGGSSPGAAAPGRPRAPAAAHDLLAGSTRADIRYLSCNPTRSTELSRGTEMTGREQALEALLQEDRTFPPPEEFRARANASDPEIYRRAAEDPE